MAATWKTVRVFISSTFRDMHAERDHLIKVAFPKLRQWCEQRRLHLVDVDLRWEVTEAEANNGKAIDICLKEIDGSRPFFVCIMGGRYGWVPDALPAEERHRFRGLQDVTHRSITHLEILHATDRPIATLDGQRGEVCSHAFFYFREDGCIPPADSPQVQESQRRRHAESYFDQDRPHGLLELKQWIRSRFQKTGQVHEYAGQRDASAENSEEDTVRDTNDRLIGRLTELGEFGEQVFVDLLRGIEVQFWDVDRGRELHVLRGHKNWVKIVTFSSDGQRLATASDDATARVWDVETGECVEVVRGEGDMAAIAAGAEQFPLAHWRKAWRPSSRTPRPAGRSPGLIRIWVTS